MSRSNQQPIRPAEPIRDPSWRFNFGKYRGETLADVLYCDFQYVNWLMENTEFDVHCDLLEDREERYRTGLKQLFGKTTQPD